MNNLISYVFFDRYRDESSSNWVYERIDFQRFDSDSQAELHVNELRDSGKIPTDIDGNPKNGLTIRRGDVEWYSAGV